MSEIIMGEEEYYDLFKALQLAIETFPDFMEQHRDLLVDMKSLFMSATGTCDFIIIRRYVPQEEGKP